MPFFRPDIHVQHQRYHPEYPRQWGPHLMTHVGQEFALRHASRFRSLLCLQQLNLRLFHLRHIQVCPDHPQWGPIFTVAESRVGGHPAHLCAPQETVFEVDVTGAILHPLTKVRFQSGEIIRVHAAGPSPVITLECSRRQPEQFLQLGGPDHIVGSHVPVEYPDPSRPLGQDKALAALPEGPFHLFSLLYLRFELPVGKGQFSGALFDQPLQVLMVRLDLGLRSQLRLDLGEKPRVEPLDYLVGALQLLDHLDVFESQQQRGPVDAVIVPGDPRQQYDVQDGHRAHGLMKRVLREEKVDGEGQDGGDREEGVPVPDLGKGGRGSGSHSAQHERVENLVGEGERQGKEADTAPGATDQEHAEKKPSFPGRGGPGFRLEISEPEDQHRS